MRRKNSFEREDVAQYLVRRPCTAFIMTLQRGLRQVEEIFLQQPRASNVSRLNALHINQKLNLKPLVNYLLMSSDESTNAISSCPRPTTNLPAAVPGELLQIAAAGRASVHTRVSLVIRLLHARLGEVNLPWMCHILVVRQMT